MTSAFQIIVLNFPQHFTELNLILPLFLQKEKLEIRLAEEDYKFHKMTNLKGL
jgi:hypothetical protein